MSRSFLWSPDELKSDHFGIETCHRSGGIHYALKLKSDHFGIETLANLEGKEFFVKLKSDHFGIETGCFVGC